MISRKSAPVALALAAMAAVAALPVTAQTVTRDADTGQLRAPTAEEAKALRGAAARTKLRSAATTSTTAITSAETTAEPVQRTLPHGAVAADTDESTLMYSVVRRQSDGSLARDCVQGEANAKLATTRVANFAKPLTPMSTARTARGAQYEEK